MIFIYYGSQFGTCKYLSFNLKSILEEKYKININCDSLNIFDFSIKNDEKIFIIITSTYGNGDSPENAAQFWKHIKNRKLKNDYFKNMKYISINKTVRFIS